MTSTVSEFRQSLLKKIYPPVGFENTPPHTRECLFLDDYVASVCLYVYLKLCSLLSNVTRIFFYTLYPLKEVFSLILLSKLTLFHPVTQACLVDSLLFPLLSPHCFKFIMWVKFSNPSLIIYLYFHVTQLKLWVSFSYQFFYFLIVKMFCPWYSESLASVHIIWGNSQHLRPHTMISMT